MRSTPFRVAFVALFVVSAALGVIGCHQYLLAQDADTSALNVLGGTISLFFGGGLISSADVPLALALAGVLAPLTTIVAAVEALSGRIEGNFRRWRARRRSNHVVLVGLGSTGQLIAAQLADEDRACVIGVDLRDGILSSLFDRPRWAVIEGSGLSDAVLRRAGAHNAAMVHVATGRDGVDLAVAETLRRLASERTVSGSLDVRVQVDSPTLGRRLLRGELETSESPAVSIEYLNINGLAAAAVVEFITEKLTQLTGELPGATLARRFDVVGDTATCTEIQRLAHRSHRARALLGLTSMTLDRPEEAITPQWAPPDDPVRSLHLPFDVITVVGFDDPARTIEAAMDIARAHRRQVVVALGPTGTEPVVLSASSDAAATLMVDPDALVQTPQMLSFGPIELMARLIHLDYLSVAGTTASEATVSWSALPATFRRASRAQAFDFGVKLGLLGCELSETRDDVARFGDEEIERLAEHEHERWMAERRADGWVHGAQRDDVRRIHPDLVPYDRLSEATKDLDRQAVTRLPALAALIGLVVVRRVGAGPGGSFLPDANAS
ncbi:MAG: RyR domain-containing protein [Microthrixaceae bacterium]